MSEGKASFLTFLAFVVGIIAIGFSFMSWSTINEGHRGVYVCFGDRINEKPIQPGFQWQTPAVCGYQELNIRVQDYKTAESVKTSSGLNAHMKATLRFRMNEKKVNWVYDNLGGPSSINNKIKNSFQGSLKEAADQFSDEELYTTKSKQYENTVEEIVKSQLESLGFTVHDVILNNINFNKALEKEITKKRTMEQRRQRKEKQVEVEKAEAERKRAEAKGVRDFEEIVSSASFTKPYLNYLWIEMLKKTDNQVLYVPMSGDSGIDMFKDMDKTDLSEIGPSNK